MQETASASAYDEQETQNDTQERAEGWFEESHH